MSASNSDLRVRRSLYDLQDDYEAGTKEPLDALMRAWKGIKELPPDNPDSFFVIGGYHGAPFRGGGRDSYEFWGGYCNHGNVLFPTWHRVYLKHLEDALRRVPGCAAVTIPFWDETEDRTMRDGIPWALTNKDYTFGDGTTIPNPLRSFTFPRKVDDTLNAGSRNDPTNPNYSKPQGYETVRYPLSGLVGSLLDEALTRLHNSKYEDYERNVKLLNENVTGWLAPSREMGNVTYRTNVAGDYEKCLEADNYTVFSNTTSASYRNDINEVDLASVVPLEKPHNAMHIAIGGYTPAGTLDPSKLSPLGGANGDMGENDTAGLDPIFHFHHCFIDRVFWLWQQRHDATRSLEVIEGYPGTNTSDLQGPTPGFAPNTWLNLDTPLNPFRKEDGTPYTSRDCIDIEDVEGHMKYTYGPGGPGSLDKPSGKARPASTARTVRVSGINRNDIRGSFVVNAFAIVDGRREHVGTEAVLSRWNVNGCANCQTHLDVKAFIDMPARMTAAQESSDDVELTVEVSTKGSQPNRLAAIGPGAAQQDQAFQIELLG